jgi:hypothetical protein
LFEHLHEREKELELKRLKLEEEMKELQKIKEAYTKELE